MKPIFSSADWDKIKDTYRRWWRRELGRPVINLSFYGCDPGMECPEGNISENLNLLSADPPELVAKKFDFMMRSKKYEADGYPGYWFYFGPIYGVEFYGAKAYFDEHTTWYIPDKFVDLESFHPSLSPDSVYLPRLRELYRAFNRYFGSSVASSSPPAFCFDYLSPFLSSDDMALAFYDHPADVKRCMNEFMVADLELRDSLAAEVKDAPGFTTWGGIFAPEVWDGTQCDYCAMISPAHFKEFVLPVIKRSIGVSPDYNYYHLDGPGELCHLDMILSIDKLKCVQWVPPPGDGSIEKWGWIFRRISEAEKNIWFCGSLDELERLIDYTGTPEGIYMNLCFNICEYDSVMKRVEKFIK